MPTYGPINAVSDTWVGEALPTTPHLTEGALQLFNAGGDQKWMFIDFRIRDNIPNNAIVSSATLKLEVITSTTDGSVRLQPVLTDWPGVQHWNNAQLLTYGPEVNDFAVSAKGIYTLDVTTVAQAIVASGGFGFRGIKISGSTLTRFASIEDTGGAQKPNITVVYTVPALGGLKRGPMRGVMRGVMQGAI